MLVRTAACPIALAALLVPALPAASLGKPAPIDPKKGHYVESTDNVIVVIFDLAGGKIRNFSHHDGKCVQYTVPLPKITVGNGSFAFEGSNLKDGNSQEWTVKLSGKATSKTVIKGSMTYEKTKGNARCKTTTKFKAIRTGPPKK